MNNEQVNIRQHFQKKAIMLKNFLSSLGMASIVATSVMYAKTPVKSEVLGTLTTTPSITISTAHSTIAPEYAVAGQSGQILQTATKSGALSITIAPESTTASIQKPSKNPVATSGAVAELKVGIEPVIKTTEPSPIPTVVPTPKPSPKPVVAAVQLPAHELDSLFQKYGAEYGVSWEKLKAIAKCESNFNAGVVSKNGLYGGMYQYVASTWVGTRKQMGLDPNPELRFNAEEAIRTTAWKISQGGIGAWPVCGKR